MKNNYHSINSLIWLAFLTVFFHTSLLPVSVNGEKILVLEFLSSKSHKNVYDPLIFELAQRGHSMTVISPYNSPKPHKNIRDIIGISEKDIASLVPNMVQLRLENKVSNPFENLTMHETVCRAYYELPEVKAITKEKFNLVIVSSFINECTFGLIHRLDTPFMFVTTFAPLPWTAAITGTPSPPSFVPLPFFNSNDKMNFLERVKNFAAQLGFKTFSDIAYAPEMEKVYRDYMGEDTPSIAEIEKNVSLILSNSHFTLNYPRPYLPDIVEVGGMHCRPSQPLPKDLNEFLSGSGKDGFIFFSMGSIVQTKDLPEEYRKMFLQAFSKLKQRVLWKWDSEMTDLPQNVRLGSWLPQQDVLGHPNIKMFITHGGLLSTEEAVYHGVPLIGIPIFGDQDWNMMQSESNGFALTLEFSDLTEEKLLATINKMLTDTKYSTRAKELSSLFRDRPQKPLDEAVYWTEYVMRHKGAIHLRSPARDLNWFAYHSLDVISLVTVTIALVLYIIKRLLGAIYSCLCRSKVSKSKKSN